MKPIIPSTLLAALFAVSAAHAAATDPVGYVSIGDTTLNQPAIKAQTDVVVSIPLDLPAVFAGTVSAPPSGNTVTFSGTPGLTTFTGPHILKIESGAASGLVALIVSNTANSVTVSLQPGDSLAGVAANAAVTIRPAWTLSKISTGNNLPNGIQLLTFDGNVPGINQAASNTYFWNGSAWENQDFEEANNVVLYTGESFLIRNTTLNPISQIVLSGEVPTSNSRVIISKLGAAAQDNRLSYVSPVGEVIGSSGLGAALASGDSLFVFNNGTPGINKAADQTLFWTGSTWEDGDFNDVTTTFSLKGGEGYVLRKAAASPAGDAVWSDAPEYVTSL